MCVCIWCLSFVSILQESSFNALVTGCDLVAIISSHRLCLTRFLLFCLSFVYLYLSLACNLLSVSQWFLVTMEKEFYTQVLRLHSMPSEFNKFTKNITIYPRNKICKREIEFQISLYVLIIQEKQKKNSVRAIILRYRDVSVHFNGHSKNQWRHTENTVRINATNNNAFIEYNSLQLLCDLIFFFFLFHNWMSVLILDKGLWGNKKKRSDVVKKYQL